MDKFGVDGLLGLFLPEVGDLVGLIVGLYTVGIAFQRKTSKLVIARMLINLAADAAIGAVPVLGDVGDFVFKANDRNVKLLEESSERGGKATWRDWLAVIGAFILLIGVLWLVVWSLMRLIRWIF